jgi:hypothetical protein
MSESQEKQSGDKKSGNRFAAKFKSIQTDFFGRR